MATCFVCDSKLLNDTSRVCSSATEQSGTPFAEKISEVVGENCVVIVTPKDHLCRRCTSLINYVDKIEDDVKIVKKAMVTSIQVKYGILSRDEPVDSVDIVNGHIMISKPTNVPKKTVPNKVSEVRENCVQPPLRRMKDTKIKIYKCGFCAFQSKDLLEVKLHVKTHSEQKNNETSNKNEVPLVSPQASQKKQVYKCEECSLIFESRSICLSHIHQNHTTENKVNETEFTSATIDGKCPQKNVNGTMDVAEKSTAKEQKSREIAERNAIQKPILENGYTKLNTEKSETNEVASVLTMMRNENDNRNRNTDIESMLAALHHETPTDRGN